MNVYNKINSRIYTHTHTHTLNLFVPVCVCVLGCATNTFISLCYMLFIPCWGAIFSEIEYWTTRAELANRFHLFICAFWADAFRILCDVNIYIQFNSFPPLLLHTLLLLLLQLLLFYCFPFTNLLSAFCTIFVLWFHTVYSFLFESAIIYIDCCSRHRIIQ